MMMKRQKVVELYVMLGNISAKQINEFICF